MKVQTTPWGRTGLSKDDLGTLRVILTDDYRLNLSAKGPRGIWRARLWHDGTKGPGEWGEIADTTSGVSPFEAALKAIRTAAGDIDEGALERQLRASLRVLGIEPVEVAS